MSANDELQAHTCEKMLEFYGKPQDYVKKSHNEQDLTELWKKGELEDGYYYVEEDGKTFISICHKHYLLQVLQDCKVLAPVPSYEEWKAAYECQLMESELVLTLKELLKECREASLDYGNHSGNYELYDRIDNAIGEKK